MIGDVDTGVMAGGGQSDWNQNDSTKLDYIKNKPNISSGSVILNDSYGAFDLSVHNAVNGVPTTYADLSAALTALNALDSTYKKPGMSFRFVRSSDNKYVQASCMAQNFTTDVTQWQGVDKEPIEGSKNLVKSGGIWSSLRKEISIDISSYPIVESKIINNGIWTSSANNGKFVPIVAGETYTFVKSNNGNVVVSVLRSNTIVLSQVADFATGYSDRIVSDTDLTITMPSDANYVYIQTTISSGNIDITPTLYSYVYKFLLEEDYEKLSEKLSVFFKPLTEFTEVDYTLTNNGVFGTNANHKHACIAVCPDEVYMIQASNISKTIFAFVTSPVAIAGGAIPYVNGTSSQSVEVAESIAVRIPEGCSYLLVYNGSDARPFNVSKFFIENGNDENDIHPKLTFDYLRGLTGEFSDHKNNFESGKYLSTPRFIKVSDKFICTLSRNVANLVVIYYDKDFNYFSYSAYNDVAANTPIEVNPLGMNYIKLCVYINANTAFEMLDVKLSGVFDKDWDAFNVRPTNGYHRIAVQVNVSDARCSDGITSTVQDSLDYRPNYGVIALPTTYSNTGKPTRLIIYGHGAGTHFTFDNSTGFDTSKHVDPAYWLAEGYAVMDVDGNPMDDTAHAFRPQAMNAYIAAYKWAIEHYNLCRDGVLLGGRSMGGGNTMYLLRSTCPIPVIAACANHPTSVAMNKTAESKLSIANMRGFIIPEGFTFSDGVMTDAETQVYYDNWEKAIRYIPSIALCVDTPTTEEWRKNFIKNCCHVGEPYESNRIAACKDLHMIVRAPFKMFGCFEDPNNGYQATAQLYMTMLGNAGQQAEYRLFHSDKATNYPNDSRSEHYYELADPTLRVNKTTIFGIELTNVPIVYIEMLQFWRRYEQGN